MLIGCFVVDDGDLLLLLEHMLHRRGLDTVRISKVKGHADDGMVLHGQVRQVDRLRNELLMRLLILVVGGSVLLSLMPVVTCLGFVLVGILSFLIFIVFSLLFLVRWLTWWHCTSPNGLVCWCSS